MHTTHASMHTRHEILLMDHHVEATDPSQSHACGNPPLSVPSPLLFLGRCLTPSSRLLHWRPSSTTPAAGMRLPRAGAAVRPAFSLRPVSAPLALKVHLNALKFTIRNGVDEHTYLLTRFFLCIRASGACKSSKCTHVISIINLPLPPSLSLSPSRPLSLAISPSSLRARALSLFSLCADELAGKGGLAEGAHF
jgi:hypothetical protein